MADDAVHLVTNGEELRLWLFQGAVRADVALLQVARRELREQWSSLYLKLNKAAVIAYKGRLGDALEQARS